MKSNGGFLMLLALCQLDGVEGLVAERHLVKMSQFKKIPAPVATSGLVGGERERNRWSRPGPTALHIVIGHGGLQPTAELRDA